jgi:hypothetical protein
MELGSLCALGGGVPLPIKNILKYFSDEINPYLSEQLNEKLADKSDTELDNKDKAGVKS